MADGAISTVTRAVLLAGVDEAGRGPLIGPVVAAAVILNPADVILGIDDSKKLTASRREQLAIEIRSRSLAWSVAWADASEIDSLNILQATLLAMRRALMGLAIAPNKVQVDGNRCPSMADLPFTCEFEAIIGGDAKVAAIGAASILAKTVRDQMLAELDAVYPGFGLAGHKGYPTAGHFSALHELGPTPIHRRSFEPVKSLVQLPLCNY